MAAVNESLIYIPLEGVDKEHCALIVDKELSKVPGITSHKIELNNSRAVINTNGDLEVVPNTVKAIRGIGYEVDSKEKFSCTQYDMCFLCKQFTKHPGKSNWCNKRSGELCQCYRADRIHSKPH